MYKTQPPATRMSKEDKIWQTTSVRCFTDSKRTLCNRLNSEAAKPAVPDTTLAAQPRNQPSSEAANAILSSRIISCHGPTACRRRI